MRVVDTSVWIEWFIGSTTGRDAAHQIPARDALARDRSLSTKMSHKLGQVLGIVSLLFGESTGIQADDGVGFPRAGHPGPPLGMAGLGRGIDLAALGE